MSASVANLQVSLANRTPWIHSAQIDSLFILGPGILVTIAALLLMHNGYGTQEVSAWQWLLLVVGVDVAHVYSTLYRTYLDRDQRQALSMWLWLVPLCAWLASMLLYTISTKLFWSVLAYTAVFHFIRQQYGFVMVYSRHDRSFPAWSRCVDQITIYTATLGPMLYWHTHEKAFTWFVDGDFISLPMWCWNVGARMYGLILCSYVVKEIYLAGKGTAFNLPRNAMVLITASSWYVGIVIAQGDLVFTMTNVIAHGIPYIALTCIYKDGEAARMKQRSWYRGSGLLWIIGLLLIIAYLEEGMWDGFVWREHLAYFPVFDHLPHIETATLLAIVVPLLTVPQLTHYILDAVIWRLRDHPEWRRNLFWNTERESQC